VKLISSQAEFESLLDSQATLLVLFSREDCGYCQIALQNITQVLANFPGFTLYVLKLNDFPQLFEKYSIQSVPVLKIFKQGEAVYTGFGIRKVSDLYYQFKDYLPGLNSYYSDLEKNN
jgi:thioredoxin 1